MICPTTRLSGPRSGRAGLALLGALALLAGCTTETSSAPALSGTWVGDGQAFVFCPGGTLRVMDPTLRTTWCEGPVSADGRFTVNCAATSPGGAHTSVGRCKLTGNTLNCPYTVGSQGYNFAGTRGGGGSCK